MTIFDIFAIKSEMSTERKRDLFFKWLDYVNSDPTRKNQWEMTQRGKYSGWWFTLRMLFFTFWPIVLYVSLSYFLNIGASFMLGCLFIPLQLLKVVLVVLALMSLNCYWHGLNIKKELGL